MLLVVLLASCATIAAQDSGDETVSTWITDLSSSSFAARQAASQSLIASGAKSVPALAAACENSSDRETTARAFSILTQILEQRDQETSKVAERALLILTRSTDKSVAALAKTTFDRWQMEVCVRTITRLRRLGASIGQPTPAADGSPEVYIQISSKEWRGRDADLALLPDLGRISLFQVNQASIGNEGLAFLAKCRSVDRIFLDQVKIDARGLAAISQAPSLRRLTIKGLATLDLHGIESLCQAAALEHLSLDGSNVTSEMLPQLAKLPSLQTVDLSRTKISDKNLASLAQLPKLQTLNLTGAQIEGEGIAGLAAAPALDTLNLRGAQLGPQGLEAIGKLTQIRYLILDEIDLSSADFSLLSGMQGLRKLDVHKCQITDNNARSLAALTGVTTLLLRENPVSIPVREQISTQIPKCQIIP